MKAWRTRDFFLLRSIGRARESTTGTVPDLNFALGVIKRKRLRDVSKMGYEETVALLMHFFLLLSSSLVV